ncbi:MAG: hypothetical protein V2A58_00205, partial [Planctomycetota bacterium]
MRGSGKGKALAALCVWALALAGTSSGQGVEGKKIVGGHGYAMPTTYTLRQNVKEMERAPLDGVFVHVNRNDMQEDPIERTMRPLRWFKPPAVTIDDFSVALDDLANTRFERFKHNILWCEGSRGFAGDWFDDKYWEEVALVNAGVLAEVCRRGGFEAVWFDVEVGGSPGGGAMTWKGTSREKEHTFEEYAAKARQRGREMMSALTSVVPEFKLIISHAYGSLNRTLAGRGTDRLSEVEYGLLPAFCDG